MIVLRALSALLSYPRDDVWQALPEIAEAIRTSKLITVRQCDDLLALVDELRGADLLQAEERYVELFDRGRAMSLHLFEHLHGDDRDRGRPWSILNGFMSVQVTNCHRANSPTIYRSFSNI